jgi:hypothetical protein
MTDPRYLRRAQEPVPEALEKRLVKYALVAGAGLLAAPAAQAGVIYTPADVWITLTQNNPYYLNMDSIGLAEFRFNVTHGTYNPPYGALWAHVWATGGGILGQVGGNKAYALGQSAVIGPYANGNWGLAAAKMGSQTALGARWGYWNNVSDRFLGLRFPVGSDMWYYGWARLSVSVDPDAYYEAHLTGYAYESDLNTPIHVPGVPEPGTLGLLAGGILGLAVWRRRKQQA